MRALLKYDKDGTGGTLLGDASLAEGVPHGIKIAEEHGVEYLYHANNDAKVHKTTLNGEYVWSTDMTSAWSKDATNWPFKPTGVVVPPMSSLSSDSSTEKQVVYVADGYGLSKVHEFDTVTGNYTGIVFGGASSPLAFDCDHGISYDDRVELMVVSDRSHHRLVWIDSKGSLVDTKNLTTEVPLPCNAQIELRNYSWRRLFDRSRSRS